MSIKWPRWITKQKSSFHCTHTQNLNKLQKTQWYHNFFFGRNLQSKRFFSLIRSDCSETNEKLDSRIVLLNEKKIETDTLTYLTCNNTLNITQPYYLSFGQHINRNSFVLTHSIQYRPGAEESKHRYIHNFYRILTHMHSIHWSTHTLAHKRTHTKWITFSKHTRNEPYHGYSKRISTLYATIINKETEREKKHNCESNESVRSERSIWLNSYDFR